MPLDFKFSAPKGDFSGNIYTAPQEPGTYLVFVHYRKLMGLAMVTVRASEEIARIEITPRKAVLQPGETARFKAGVYGQSGKEIRFSPAWGAKGGKVQPDRAF